MTEVNGKSPKNCVGCESMSQLFRLLSLEELLLVDANKIHVNFKSGETIRKQGTFMSHVLSVNSGLAKLYLEGINGRSAILRIVKPTNFIGGPGIYFDQLHHFSITALVDSSVCFIDLQVFKKILTENKLFAEEFLRDFSRDVLTVYNRLINLTQQQMPGRMAHALLYLHDEIFQQSRFPMVLSRPDLADLSSMSRESAIKILREFRNEGLIRISDNHLELTDIQTLRSISHIG